VIWFMADSARYLRELGQLADLAQSVNWLTIGTPRLDDRATVCIDAEIRFDDRTVLLTLRYPRNFPYSPPSVTPRTPERISREHQYGTAELCLEYGPDNWRTDLTGADMLTSAYRLLAHETASPESPPTKVSSRHALTQGQELRGTHSRAVVTELLVEHLATLPMGWAGRADFYSMVRDESYVITCASLTGADGVVWSTPDVPAALKRAAHHWAGLAFKLPASVEIPLIKTGLDLKAFLSAYGWSPPGDYVAEYREIILVATDDKAIVFWSGTDDQFFRATTLERSEGQRVSPAHAILHSKTVGIVGCGSLGSKLAVTLARAGVRKFVLIDDDILLPENLVRHDLDWSYVGEHKVDALAARLALVAPGVECTVRRQQLGGQEAAAAADWSLVLLSGCDAVIDATATPDVFNIAAGTCDRAGKPFFWAEVFAGGIGGLIARSRPGFDPDAQTIRGRIDGWCAGQDAPVTRPAGRYATDSGDELWIADDADVSAISSHAARFVLDTLLERAPSAFPVSAYLIGLAQAWLFSQPFVVHPIDVGLAPPKPADVEMNEAAVTALVALIETRNADRPVAS
jgi:sulfur-carrier protein adenylyltransferase/sulfurtransferase